MRSCLWVQATPVQEYKNLSIDWTSKSSVWLKMWIWWLTEIGMLCSCSPASDLWGKRSFCAISIQEWAGGAVLGERSWEEKRLPSQDLGFAIGSCTFVTGANVDLAWLLWVRTVWLLLFFSIFNLLKIKVIWYWWWRNVFDISVSRTWMSVERYLTVTVIRRHRLSRIN